MSARRCWKCRTVFEGYGKQRYCSWDCRHGTDAGYAAGCREECCRRAHMRLRKQARMAPVHLVSSIGTRRRAQALACMGWSWAELSRRAGRHRSYVRKAVQKTRLHPDTAAVIARLYEELSMTRSTGPLANRVSGQARANGWAPPLAWDDETIDDPKARPHLRVTVDGVDDVVVERVLGGEWKIATTKAEKVEIVARWLADGGSLAELERLTGWNVHRYTPSKQQAPTGAAA